LVVHGPEAPAAAAAALDKRGVPRLELEGCSPRLLLEALALRGCNQVLWECGPELAAAAIAEGCVQELAAVIAPKLMGGQPARTPLGELGFTSMAQVRSWQGLEPEALGDDWLWRLRPAPDARDHP
jgi:diaminohydroxyphosphoribosylaminopyrimidine deaminase/5-amino-6-(5-phosphoribosylamino)uracil reductase